MDNNLKAIIKKRIEKTADNLRKNNMAVYFADSKEDVPGIVESLMKDGDVVSHGGSMTIAECGLSELLNSEKYTYLDRSKSAPEEVRQVYLDSFSADVYITSTNAVTEDGLLYNVDGNSNRIAAIAYGPESVIVIAGYNKIVSDLNEAQRRVKKIAAPANTIRLDCDTYCKEKGQCVSLNSTEESMCGGCSSPDRICCNYLVSAQQRHKDRIKVIIVGEELGY